MLRKRGNQFAVDLFDEVQELIYDDHAKRLNGLASPEGLALAMKYRDSLNPTESSGSKTSSGA